MFGPAEDVKGEFRIIKLRLKVAHLRLQAQYLCFQADYLLFKLRHGSVLRFVMHRVFHRERDDE